LAWEALAAQQSRHKYVSLIEVYACIVHVSEKTTQ
jgi:hypothetical protein